MTRNVVHQVVQEEVVQQEQHNGLMQEPPKLQAQPVQEFVLMEGVTVLPNTNNRAVIVVGAAKHRGNIIVVEGA